MNLDPSTPIWQLTVEQFTELIRDAQASQAPKSKRYVQGASGLAGLLNCSKRTASRIIASGRIDRAISQISERKSVIDADLAIELMKQ